MIGDYGRDTILHSLDQRYETVRYFQGRPLDASDLTAAQEMQVAYRERAVNDIIGRVAFPKRGDAFRVQPHSDGILRVGPGAMYVNGARFVQQGKARLDGLAASQRSVLVADCRKVEVDRLSDPLLADPGFNGIDTSGRSLPTVSYRLISLEEMQATNGLSEPQLVQYAHLGKEIAVPGGRIGANNGRAEFIAETPQEVADTDCLIAPDAGFTGQSNLNYKVEIQRGGTSSAVRVKWAREDVRAIIERDGQGGFALRHAPNDAGRAFKSGQVVEIKSAEATRNGEPGVMSRLTTSDGISYSLTGAALSEFDGLEAPVTIIRWDHPAGGVGVTPSGGVVPLENGLSVHLSGTHLAGDYWYCAVRTTTGQPIWPPVDGPAQVRAFNWAPVSIPLAIVQPFEGGLRPAVDLRPVFPELTHLTARDVGFDDQRCRLGAATVQVAIEKICAQLDNDSCTIRVRPREESGVDFSHCPEIEALPTLDEALVALSEKLAPMYEAMQEGKGVDPFQPFRNIHIEFTSGRYEWPRGLQEMFNTLNSVALTSCGGAAATIRATDWMAFDRCLSVRMEGLTLAFAKPDAGLSITGGKRVLLDDMTVQRNESQGASVVKLLAQRSVTVRHSRIMLKKPPKADSNRPTLQIASSQAHTVLENVSSNGDLVLGMVTPLPQNQPHRALIEMAQNKMPEDAFAMLGLAEPTTNIAEIRNCRFNGVMPGNDVLDGLTAWATGGEALGGGKVSFVDGHLARSEMVHVLAQPVEERLAILGNFEAKPLALGNDGIAVFEGAKIQEVGNLTASAELLEFAASAGASVDNALTFDSAVIRDAARAPFRRVEMSNCEIGAKGALIVAPTVVIRGTVFAKPRNDAVRIAEVREDVIGRVGLPQDFEWVFGQDEFEPTKLLLAGMAISTRTVMDGNIGFAEFDSQSERIAPVILDLSLGGHHFTRVMEIEDTVRRAQRFGIVELTAKFLTK